MSLAEKWKSMKPAEKVAILGGGGVAAFLLYLGISHAMSSTSASSSSAAPASLAPSGTSAGSPAGSGSAAAIASLSSQMQQAFGQQNQALSQLVAQDQAGQQSLANQFGALAQQDQANQQQTGQQLAQLVGGFSSTLAADQQSQMQAQQHEQSQMMQLVQSEQTAQLGLVSTLLSRMPTPTQYPAAGRPDAGISPSFGASIGRSSSGAAPTGANPSYAAQVASLEAQGKPIYVDHVPYASWSAYHAAQTKGGASSGIGNAHVRAVPAASTPVT